MTVNELVEKLRQYQQAGEGDLEALVVVDADQYPIMFVEDTGDGDFLEIATETPAYSEQRRRDGGR